MKYEVKTWSHGKSERMIGQVHTDQVISIGDEILIDDGKELATFKVVRIKHTLSKWEDDGARKLMHTEVYVKLIKCYHKHD